MITPKRKLADCAICIVMILLTQFRSPVPKLMSARLIREARQGRPVGLLRLSLADMVGEPQVMLARIRTVFGFGRRLFTHCQSDAPIENSHPIDYKPLINNRIVPGMMSALEKRITATVRLFMASVLCGRDRSAELLAPPTNHFSVLPFSVSHQTPHLALQRSSRNRISNDHCLNGNALEAKAIA